MAALVGSSRLPEGTAAAAVPAPPAPHAAFSSAAIRACWAAAGTSFSSRSRIVSRLADERPGDGRREGAGGAEEVVVGGGGAS